VLAHHHWVRSQLKIFQILYFSCQCIRKTLVLLFNTCTRMLQAMYTSTPSSSPSSYCGFSSSVFARTLGVVEHQHARDKGRGVLTQIQGMLSG
jgi:hypothetical protein